MTGPEGITVEGYTWFVSRANIRLAIAAARLGSPAFARAHVEAVEINGPSEVEVIFDDGIIAVVERVNGQWRYIRTTERTIITG